MKLLDRELLMREVKPWGEPYNEVQDMAEDEEGNPCPSGMKVCVAKNVTLEAYDILAAKFEALAATDERLLIHRLGLDELFGACKLRFITREEYEREYGD